MRRSLSLLLCATLVARASASGWPLGRAPKKAEQAETDRLRTRERLNTYETALTIQHRTLMELRQRNSELEHHNTQLLSVVLFSILWPPVLRFFTTRAASRVRKGLLRKTTFADVAGCREAKQELQEVVEFLKNPKKFTQAGARVPKGVLMEGGPGVGKTMLARAVAGEAGVSFIDTSGSELGSTIYVGVGASKVRALFAEARRQKPCIVFIDEIDAIGGRREPGGSGGSQESARTLNQLLTEMDGFAGDTGVVVIAATNRADVLDSALLRAGRFDRKVPIGAPNAEERAEILRVHVKGKKIDNSVDLVALAKRTHGFSGAELATLLNEAAIGTATRNSTVISLLDVDTAYDKMMIGLRRPSHSSKRVRETVAVHEAGHACMALLTGFDKVATVTILPRSNGVGGFTRFANVAGDGGGLPTRERLLQDLQVLLGGRIAEELAFGKHLITVGASDDLRRAHELATRMVTQYGMVDNDLGLTISGRQGAPDLSNLLSGARGQRVASSVDKILGESYAQARKTMRTNWKLVQRMQTDLLEKETLSEPEIDKLLAEHEAAMRPFWVRLWVALPSLPSLPALPVPAAA